jgi:hypothetical protein
MARYRWATCSRFLLEKLRVSHIVKQFHTFYFSRQFMGVFTTARHLYWAKIIKHTPFYTVSVGFVLILSSCLCLGLPNDFFPSLFPWQLLFLIQPLCMSRPTFLYLTSRMVRSELCKSWTSSWRTSLQLSVTSSSYLSQLLQQHNPSQWQNKFYTIELFF